MKDDVPGVTQMEGRGTRNRSIVNSNTTKGSCSVLEQETQPPFSWTGWFKERILV